jgi:16S rRNA (cytosine967-C5)-methyltransferase
MLAESYLHPAPITLRVNTEVASREEILAYLKSEGIEAEAGKLTPSSIIIKKRIPLSGMNMYRNGLVEIQDEGSQLVSYSLAPAAGSSVLDACAGAGGKTMHIASIMKDSGSILACDTEFEKIKEIKYRAARQNYHSIKSVHIRKAIPEELVKGFDYVLIDAPCSGMGTVRRIPNPKWRLTKDALEKYSFKQLELLKLYSQFVNPGGILVYSTCSSMFEENDEVIENFLNDNNDFVPDSIPEALKSFNITISQREKEDYKLHLFTHIYGCDTFFICRMRKIV